MKDSSDSSPSEQGFDNPLVKFDKRRLLNTPSEISQRANMMEFGQYGALAQKIILETIDHADHAWSFVVQFDCLEKGSEFRIVHPGKGLRLVLLRSVTTMLTLLAGLRAKATGE